MGEVAVEGRTDCKMFFVFFLFLCSSVSLLRVAKFVSGHMTPPIHNPNTLKHLDLVVETIASISPAVLNFIVSSSQRKSNLV
jgi:hypothetical protein